MTAKKIRRLMAAPSVGPTDGRAEVDPRVLRAVLDYHEATVLAAETAYRKLARLGVPDPTPLLLGRPPWWGRSPEAGWPVKRPISDPR